MKALGMWVGEKKKKIGVEPLVDKVDA